MGDDYRMWATTLRSLLDMGGVDHIDPTDRTAILDLLQAGISQRFREPSHDVLSRTTGSLRIRRQ